VNKQIPSAKTVIFENGGHRLSSQYPEKFNKIVKDFVLSLT
jgi:pimeloyl-ACP methyl ester carboxylesterase